MAARIRWAYSIFLKTHQRFIGRGRINHFQVACSHPIPYQPTYSFIDTFTTRNSENADFLTISQKAIDEIDRRLHAIQLGATNEELPQTQTNRNIYDAGVDLPLRPTAFYSSPEKTQEEESSTKKLNHAHDVDDLDVRLCQIIQQNNALYERILRYEVILNYVYIYESNILYQPLHFDVFLHLEGIKEMDGQGFKNKLRTFLDKHVSHHLFKRSNI